MVGSPLLENAVTPSAEDAATALLASRTFAGHHDAPATVRVEDEAAPLPAPAFKLLLEVLSQMARGHVVAVSAIEAELTTQQAAELLGVSRPHLVKLLEAGRVPFRKVGAHRRVKFSDLAAFRA